MKKNKKEITDKTVKAYFINYTSPSLGYLIEIFFGTLSKVKMPKDASATCANWAVRPLSNILLNMLRQIPIIP
jgi:hypothetical protein